MRRVSEARFRQSIRAASADYDICWRHLCDLKTADLSGNPQPLLDFQPRLAGALASLSRLYTDIARERNELIARKKSFSREWFRQRQKSLAARQKALDDTICVGKCLGDAFAFFFYRNDRKLLQNHLSQHPVKHLPTGIGGIGELEFVKGVSVMNGLMVVYHGITSILRIGDISLIDLTASRVAGIAELKSWSPEKGRVQITVNAIGPGLKPWAEVSSDAAASRKFPATAQLSTAAKDRLMRQLKRIEESFKGKTVTEHHSSLRLESQNHLRTLERLVREARRNRFSFVKADNGLILGAMRSPFRSLFGNVTRKLDTDAALRHGTLQSPTMSILDKTRADNSLAISTLVYHTDGGLWHLPGMAQLFWWDLSLETLRALIFHDVIVVTLFNQAHLLAALEQAGFRVDQQGEREFRITKRTGNRIVEIGGLRYYSHMIQEYLFTEAFVVRVIGDFAQRAGEIDDGYDETKADLVFNQDIAVRLPNRGRPNRKV